MNVKIDTREKSGQSNEVLEIYDVKMMLTDISSIADSLR